MAKAFEGIRVIDFTQVLAGPFCTAQLALLGADVIKVEQPGTGDQSRTMMAEPEYAALRMSPMFLSVNAGKRAMTLDLKHPEARDVVHRLVRDADVVVQNFKAGTMERMGFGWEQLREINPRLVYCSISGYGQAGPNAGAPAYDGAVQAASGLMACTGHEHTGPTRTGFTSVDVMTGISAAFAVAGALFRRAATGEGQHLDVAMFDSALTLLAPLAANYLVAGIEPMLLGNMGPTRAPTADAFKARDGYMLMTALTDAQFAGICRAIGREDLIGDPRFADDASRRANGAALRHALDAAFAEDDAASWEKRLARQGVALAPVNTLPQALAHPQLAHRDLLLRLRVLDREVQLVGAAFGADRDGPGTDWAPPTLGQHTDEILAEIGYAASGIAALRQAKAV